MRSTKVFGASSSVLVCASLLVAISGCSERQNVEVVEAPPAPITIDERAPIPNRDLAESPVGEFFSPVELSANRDHVGGNLLRGGGFEIKADDWPNPWTFEGDADVVSEREGSYYIDGHYSLRVEAPQDQDFRASRTFKNTFHSTYVLHCNVFAKELSSDLRLEVNYPIMGDEKAIFHSAPLEAAEGAWSLLELKFEVPALVPNFSVTIDHVASDNPSDEANIFWIDECKLYLVESPLRENLLLNGDFAKGPDDELEDWGWWKEHKISRVSDSLISESMRVTCREGQPVTFRQVIGDRIIPGRRYRVRGYLHTSNRSGKVLLRVSNKAGIPIASTEGVRSNRWTPVEATFTAPKDIKDLQFLLMLSLDPDAPKATSRVGFAHIELFEEDDE